MSGPPGPVWLFPGLLAGGAPSGPMALDERTGQELEEIGGAHLRALVATPPQGPLPDDVMMPLWVARGVAWARQEGAPPPSAVIGYSCGLYAALCVAGALELAEALELVRQSQRALTEMLPWGRSDLMGVLGLPEEEALALAAREGAHPACLNGPRHVVVGGEVAALEALGRAAGGAGAFAARRLGLRYAYHTPCLAPAQGRWRAQVELHRWRPAHTPVWSTREARPLRQTGELAQEVASHLFEPVRWQATLSACLSSGARVFVEAGPAGLLCRLARGMSAPGHFSGSAGGRWARTLPGGHEL